jgi:hypothetical protein
LCYHTLAGSFFSNEIMIIGICLHNTVFSKTKLKDKKSNEYLCEIGNTFMSNQLHKISIIRFLPLFYDRLLTHSCVVSSFG